MPPPPCTCHHPEQGKGGERHNFVGALQPTYISIPLVCGYVSVCVAGLPAATCRIITEERHFYIHCVRRRPMPLFGRHFPSSSRCHFLSSVAPSRLVVARRTEYLLSFPRRVLEFLVELLVDLGYRVLGSNRALLPGRSAAWLAGCSTFVRAQQKKR
jgi:hypothetical protein